MVLVHTVAPNMSDDKVLQIIGFRVFKTPKVQELLVSDKGLNVLGDCDQARVVKYFGIFEPQTADEHEFADDCIASRAEIRPNLAVDVARGSAELLNKLLSIWLVFGTQVAEHAVWILLHVLKKKKKKKKEKKTRHNSCRLVAIYKQMGPHERWLCMLLSNVWRSANWNKLTEFWGLFDIWKFPLKFELESKGLSMLDCPVDGTPPRRTSNCGLDSLHSDTIVAHLA